MIRRGLLLLACAALPALAQPTLALAQTGGPGTTDPATAARAAAERLDQAARQLDSAATARNRVRALSETLRAYEDGLAATRDGLRRAALRENALQAMLDTRQDEIARLMGVLQTIGTDPAPVRLLHPAGALGTARSGMILSDVAPALDARAAELRTTLAEVRDLRLLQNAALTQLEAGLGGVQTARAELSHAIADRKELPRRFIEDPVRTALLIASTETLQAFASGLSGIAESEVPGSLPDISDRRGALPMPVRGRVLRRAGEADAAGVTRPGIVVATRPRALVTTPTAATIRYRGPLLDYGNVMILEPQAGTLFVIAGLDVVYGAAGEVLPAGTPVGLMGGTDPRPGEIAETAARTGAGERTETLYIEVRRQDAPQDPETWFATTKEG